MVAFGEAVLVGRKKQGGRVSRAEKAVVQEDLDLLLLMGRAIKGYRIRAGMTQAEMADRLLISLRSVKEMESGHARVSMGYYLGACRLVGLPLLDSQSLIGAIRELDLGRKRASGTTDFGRFE